MSPKKNVIKDHETKKVMRRRSNKGRDDEDEVDDTQTKKDAIQHEDSVEQCSKTS